MGGLNLKHLGKPFAAISGKEYVGIDFSGNSLKIAHLRAVSGRIEVVNLISRNIQALSDDDIAKIIKSSFPQLSARTLDVVNVIPTHVVITKNIEIPSTNPKEIKEIISLQAGRHTPFSREEIIVDYLDIGTHKRSYTKILLIIVSRNVIKRQFDIIERAGLKLDRVFFAPEAVGLSTSRILKLDPQEAPLAVVNIDEGFSDFTVVIKDRVIFVRNIPIGATHLGEEPDKYQSRFADEIKSSLETYQSEDIERAPTTIAVTGAIEDLKNLVVVLNERLKIPCKAVSYFRNIILSNEAFNKVTLAKHLSYFNVISSLLCSKEMKIDLVPEEVRVRKALEERGKDLITAGVLVLTIFVFVFLILISNIYFSSAYLSKLDDQYKPLSQEAGKLEVDYAKISLLKSYLAKRGFSLEVLSELYSVLSDNLTVADIKYDDQGKFSVRGTAVSMSDVFTFVEKMEDSKFFKDVKTKYTTKRKDGSRDVTDFEIVCTREQKK